MPKKTTTKKSSSQSKSTKKSAPKRASSSSTTKKKSTKKATPRKKKAPKKKAKPAQAEAEVTIDRRRSERRDEEPKSPQLERREKVNRRRQIDPTTCERDYSDQEVEFMNALDDYKRRSGRMFPTCSEVLEVVRELGYVQLSPAELATRTDTEQTDNAASIDDVAEATSIETDPTLEPELVGSAG